MLTPRYFAAVLSLTACLLTASAFAQESGAAKIQRAMSAAPDTVSARAMIMDTDGTTLRAGNNGWTCMPSVMPGDRIPMCNDAVWMKLMQALANKQPFKTDKIGISYMLKGDIPTNNDDPYDTSRDEGEPWVEEGPHLMILVPDKAMLEGISNDPNSGGPYVMWKDTPYAHIMVPVAPRQKK